MRMRAGWILRGTGNAVQHRKPERSVQLPVFHGERAAGRRSAMQRSNGVAEQAAYRPADKSDMRTMRRALHSLQQPTAILSTMQSSCSPGAGAGTELGGISAKAGTGEGTGRRSMTGIPFRRERVP